jgi:hypothetical protein
VQPLDSFPAFYLTRQFITAFTRTLHLYLTRSRPIQSTPPNSFSKRSILMLSIHLGFCLPSGPFPSGFPTNNLLLHSCYMPRPPHPPRLDNFNYTWRRAQIMQLLVMQLSPSSRYSVPLWSKYSPQRPVLKHPQFIFLSYCQRSCFTPI